MQMPEMLDNVSKTVKDDLAATITKGDKLSVAAACFSIYAYQSLRKRLDGIAELRFIFTSPTFLQEETPKTKREFYIPRLGRERSLYGTEFEVKLRNELTQKAIARECADWIRKKVQFRSNLTGGSISGFMNVVGAETAATYVPLHGFSGGIDLDKLNWGNYNSGDRIACFEECISEKAIHEIAGRKPLRAVFRDSGFTSSPEKINVFEIFKLLAPNTTERVI